MQANDYEYEVVKCNTHHDLAKVMNENAPDGWELMEAYAHGPTGSFNHFGVFRRLKPKPANGG